MLAVKLQLTSYFLQNLYLIILFIKTLQNNVYCTVNQDPSAVSDAIRFRTLAILHLLLSYEPRHEKTGFLPKRKQRRRSAVQ